MTEPIPAAETPIYTQLLKEYRAHEALLNLSEYWDLSRPAESEVHDPK